MQDKLPEEFFGNDSDQGTMINPQIHHKDNTDMQQMEPLKDNLRLVENGKLDKKTGVRKPLTSKAQTIISRNLLPSQQYLDNFDNIKFYPVKDGKRNGYKVRTGGRWYV